MIPPLKPFKWLSDEINNKVGSRKCQYDDDFYKNYLINFRDIYTSFGNILYNLEPGYYNIKLFWYLEWQFKLHNSLFQVYTQDPYNKNCFNLLLGSFGYSLLASPIEYLNGNNQKYTEELIQVLLAGITAHLGMMINRERYRGIINLKKDTLMVITKSNKYKFDDYKNHEGDGNPYRLPTSGESCNNHVSNN